MSTTAATPLLGGGAKGGSGGRRSLSEWFCDWLCGNLMDNGMILCFLAGGVACILVAVLGFHIWIIPILGGIVVFGAANRVWALRNLAAEIDRFSEENERLEVTQAKLTGEVKTLTEKKEELSGNVKRLEGTVNSLTDVNEGLHNELAELGNLKGRHQNLNV